VEGCLLNGGQNAGGGYFFSHGKEDVAVGFRPRLVTDAMLGAIDLQQGNVMASWRLLWKIEFPWDAIAALLI
jgi:hypothetical protein